MEQRQTRNQLIFNQSKTDHARPPQPNSTLPLTSERVVGQIQPPQPRKLPVLELLGEAAETVAPQVQFLNGNRQNRQVSQYVGAVPAAKSLQECGDPK